MISFEDMFCLYPYVYFLECIKDAEHRLVASGAIIKDSFMAGKFPLIYRTFSRECFISFGPIRDWL